MDIIPSGQTLGARVEVMRQQPGSRRAKLTEAQKLKKPPVSQPRVRIHPLTGRKILYANPGYTIWIDGMDEHESGTILDYLFRHQERADFLYAHHWAVGDVLMWDNIRGLEPKKSPAITIH